MKAVSIKLFAAYLVLLALLPLFYAGQVLDDFHSTAASFAGFTRLPVTVDGGKAENGGTSEYVQPEAVMLGLHAYTASDMLAPPEGTQQNLPLRGSVAS